MDYNSSSFRNGAIDKLKGKFGQQTQRSVSASSGTLTNPFQQKSPLSAGLGDTSIKRPTAPKAPSTKPVEKAPETKPTAMASENKPAAATKTVKQVRKETNVAVAEAKGKAKVAKANMKAAASPDEKMELREKRAGNFGKAVKYGLETVATGLGLYGTYKSVKKG
tara:strand:+ start:620 stop:1114 length:495 start_codon:yes stop_codon:yes gene_type:complete